ncbi:MAG TPA: ester cyclase [Nitrososphaera sp.]|nr:ester cyclase [Nitrososphaera sp.]
MGVEEKNMQLMQTLDDAWNSQDWDTFEQRHAENCLVFWPGQPEPTKGVKNHRQESAQFFKSFPDNHVSNRPYKIFFANGDFTCSVADFTGTFKGELKMGDKTMPPTGKSFKVEFCTVAEWKDGKITEERLFYDLVGFMKQIGIM